MQVIKGKCKENPSRSIMDIPRQMPDMAPSIAFLQPRPSQPKGHEQHSRDDEPLAHAAKFRRG